MKSSKLMIILLWIILVMGCIDLQKEHKYAVSTTEDTNADTQEKESINWVEFNVTCEAMKKAYQYDLDTYGEEVHLDWVSLLAYLGAKYGGDFTRYKEKDMDEIAQMLLTGEKTEELLAGKMKYYDYYREAYGAVLDGMVGEYEREYPLSTEEAEGSEIRRWISYKRSMIDSVLCCNIKFDL